MWVCGCGSKLGVCEGEGLKENKTVIKESRRVKGEAESCLYRKIKVREMAPEIKGADYVVGEAGKMFKWF